MDTFWGLSATTWTAIYTLITAGLLIVAVAAAWYARRQWGAGRAAVEDARKAQMEALRPYITVTVEPSRTSMQLFDIIVRNVGSRPAENVAIKIDPPPVRARDESNASYEISKMRMLTEPIAQVAPGQEIRAFYDNQIERANRDDLPTSHSVNVRYRDSTGNDYQGRFLLDLEALKGMLFQEVGTVHTLSKSLKSIDKTLKSSDLISRGHLGVDAVLESRHEREHRRVLAEHEQRKELLDLDRLVRPEDPSLPRQEEQIARQEQEFARRLEDEAVEPIMRRVRQARYVARWVRKTCRANGALALNPVGLSVLGANLRP